jgi:hypothetical protein
MGKTKLLKIEKSKVSLSYFGDLLYNLTYDFQKSSSQTKNGHLFLSIFAKSKKVLEKSFFETIKFFSVSRLFPNFSICDDKKKFFLIN